MGAWSQTPLWNLLLLPPTFIFNPSIPKLIEHPDGDAKPITAYFCLHSNEKKNCCVAEIFKGVMS